MEGGCSTKTSRSGSRLQLSLVARGIYSRCPLVASFERETEGRERQLLLNKVRYPVTTYSLSFTLLHSLLFSTLSSLFFNEQQTTVSTSI